MNPILLHALVIIIFHFVLCDGFTSVYPCRRLGPHGKLNSYLPSVRPPLTHFRSAGTLRRSSIGDSVDAIDKMASQKISALQLSTMLGTTVQDAHHLLQKLAFEGGGKLEVTKSGDILYTFPSNFKRKLSQTSARRKAEIWLHDNKAILKELFRKAVAGTAYVLLVTMAVSISMLTVAAAGSREEKEDKEKRKRKQPSSDYYYHYHYHQPYFTNCNNHNRFSVYTADRPGQAWLQDSVINFIFGPDKDPKGEMQGVVING
jgi:hypothetical protein